MRKIYDESPFCIEMSLTKMLAYWEKLASDAENYKSSYAQTLLRDVEAAGLAESVLDPSKDYLNNELVGAVLNELFTQPLAHVEIKAIAAPFTTHFFYVNKAFSTILEEAGTDYKPTIDNISAENFYILACCYILKTLYKYDLKIDFPIIMNIPDAKGVIQYYKLNYHLDFAEIRTTNRTRKIKPEEIKFLLDSGPDMEIWKRFFPVESYVLRGFMVVSLQEVTSETAISKLKSILVRSLDSDLDVQQQILPLFRSLFNICDLNGSFYLFDHAQKQFGTLRRFDGITQSTSLEIHLEQVVHDCMLQVLSNNRPLIISDTSNCSQKEAMGLAKQLVAEGIASCILAPAIRQQKPIGVVLFYSAQRGAIHAVIEEKLQLVIPILTDSIERLVLEMENEIEAVIQREYTSIHPSVYWKFREEVIKKIDPFGINHLNRENKVFEDIVFKDVYALYGQTDIKDSSLKKNEAILQDLKAQLKYLQSLFSLLEEAYPVPVIQQTLFTLKNFETELEAFFQNELEHVHYFIVQEIHPILSSLCEQKYQDAINTYFGLTDKNTGLFFKARRDMDDTIMMINNSLTSLLDVRNLKAQKMFPHYYERFKTDGVEHNLYIGASIAPDRKFGKFYIDNLRLFQLETICEMEFLHHKQNRKLPCQLEVSSLILVYGAPLSIRFRIDEKQFDVDGTYNARYEMVKKRIDKAHVKGTSERITAPHTIAIVYQRERDRQDYIRYAKYLQHKGYLTPDLEVLEVEDLQGISGLKVIRVQPNYERFEN